MTSQCLSFIIYKMKMIIILATSQDVFLRIKWVNTFKVPRVGPGIS